MSYVHVLSPVDTSKYDRDMYLPVRYINLHVYSKGRVYFGFPRAGIHMLCRCIRRAECIVYIFSNTDVLYIYV